MSRASSRFKKSPWYRICSILIVAVLSFSLAVPPGFAQLIPTLPAPGVRLQMSPGFTPAIIRGMKIFADNPLQFDFIVDRGDSGLKGEALKAEGEKLIKYFMAALTVPEEELWVNLSPYEEGKIIPQSFGLTDMGRDLLAQDYILKQLTSSLMYPEDELGKKFWDRVYKKANELFGTTEIPINTFNKIWIVPEKAVVFEQGDTAFIAESHLKVMLEEDYLSMMNNLGSKERGTDRLAEDDVKTLSNVSSQIVKDVLIPEIEKEVNEGKNFANLRQIYNSMILATWYKVNLRESLLGQIYVDQNKTKGIDIEDKDSKEKIYQQYLEAFKKGVYNYIKEDVDPATQEVIPRKYFSGGFDGDEIRSVVATQRVKDPAMLASVSPIGVRNIRQFEERLAAPQVSGDEQIVSMRSLWVENAGREQRSILQPSRPAERAMLATLKIGQAEILLTGKTEGLDDTDLEIIINAFNRRGIPVKRGDIVEIIDPLEDPRVPSIHRKESARGGSTRFLVARNIHPEPMKNIAKGLRQAPEIKTGKGETLFALNATKKDAETALGVRAERLSSRTQKPFGEEITLFMNKGKVSVPVLGLGAQPLKDKAAEATRVNQIRYQLENIRSLLATANNAFNPSVGGVIEIVDDDFGGANDQIRSVRHPNWQTYQVVQIPRSLAMDPRKLSLSQPVELLAPSSGSISVRDRAMLNGVDQLKMLRLNVDKAIESPWSEFVRYSGQEAPAPEDQEHNDFFSNQVDTRPEILRLLNDIAAGTVKEEIDFGDRLVELYAMTLAGKKSVDDTTRPIRTYRTPTSNFAIGTDQDLQQFINSRKENFRSGSRPEALRNALVSIQDYLRLDPAKTSDTDLSNAVARVFVDIHSGDFSPAGNNSIAMNFSNVMLRLHNRSGISHGLLDVNFRAPDFNTMFLAKVREVNASPDRAMTARADYSDQDWDTDSALLRDANLAKKIGDIPHRAGYFSVNWAVKAAAEQNRISDLRTGAEFPDVEQQLLAYWREPEINQAFMRLGVNVADIERLLKDNATKLLLVEDTKNGSPALMIRSDKDYQVAHVGLGLQSVYVAKELIGKLLRDNKPGLVKLLLTRELIALSKTKELQSKGKKYNQAVVEAESFADSFEKALVRNTFNEYLQATMNDFIDDYNKTLSEKNVVWDYESSLLRGRQGKNLIGGKSYQAGGYWAADPENNLRSFSGTTTASMRFLQSDPVLLPKIYEIMRQLDTSKETDRERAYAEIRKLILATSVPESIAADLRQAYRELVQVTGQQSVAVRSSGKAEDISIKSEALKGVTLGANAGQHDTYLGEVGEDAVVERWKYNVASLYTDRVLDYRDGIMVLTAFDDLLQQPQKVDQIVVKLSASQNSDDQLVGRALKEKNIKIVSSLKVRDALARNGFADEARRVDEARDAYIKIENIAMGVTIMPMADTDVSFVAFGHELAANWTAMNFQSIDPAEYKNTGRVVTVTTNWGIGESIVQGAATPDTYVVHIFEDPDQKDADGKPMQRVNILSRQIGTKTVMAVYTGEARNRLGLTDADIDNYLSFVRTGQAPQGLKNVKAGASLSRVKEVLENIIAPKVDMTDEALAGLTDSDVGMFEGYQKKDLKLLAHLLKAFEKDRNIKTMFTDVPKELRDQFSATDTQVMKIAREYMKKAEGYGHLVDMEGTIGRNLGGMDRPATVQRRPSNIEGDVDSPKEIKIDYTYVRPEDVKEKVGQNKIITLPDGRSSGLSEGDLLVQGIPTRNSFSGRVYRIDEGKELVPQFEEIKAIADQGTPVIIRTKETTPDFVPILKYNNVMGVIADVGGATSHAAVVSRELGIATVVGIQTWMDKLETDVGPERANALRKYINTSGNLVTVDANADEKSGLGVVYAGELPINKRSIDIRLDRLPKVATKIAYIMGMPHPMLTVSKMAQYEGYYGVALMRGEFAYAEENINPRAGRAYDVMVAHDYLKVESEAKNGKTTYFDQEMSKERRDALKKFKAHLAHRKITKEKGVELFEDRIERMVREAQEKNMTPSDFLNKKITETQRNDVRALRNNPEEVKRLTEQIKGYTSYDEFFDAVHGGAVGTMAAANGRDNNTVVYRSIDFKKNEARELIGSVVFDPNPEPATMVGERGARWLLQPENRVILREEVRMLLRQVARGYTNIGFMFPFVSTPNELDQLLTILEREEQGMSRELGRAVYLREVGQMIELPSNVVEAEDFLKVLQKHEKKTKDWFRTEYKKDIKRTSFFSFGTNDLTQLTMGADRDNPAMKYLFNEANPFVVESIRHVVNMAKKYGVKTGLCGQALVNLVNINPEAAEEILMLLGSTGGYAGTDYLGTLAAINRAASATLKHGVIKESAAARTKLADTFVSNLNRGAAARPFFNITSKQDWAKTYIGDFAFVDDNMFAAVSDAGDITDDQIKESVGRLGALLYTGDDLDAKMAAVSKKYRVPTVKVGADVQARLAGLNGGLNGAPKVTIDFNNKKIFDGEIDVETVIPSTEGKIVIPEKRADNVRSIAFSQRFSSSQFYQGLGLHPLAFLAYDDPSKRERLSEEARRTIADLISQEGVSSATDFLKKHLAKAIKAKLPNIQSELAYETFDLQSDDLVALKGHQAFLEEAEINPPLGFAGLDALVKDEQWKKLFTLEMETVKSVIDEGYGKVAVQFNSIKVPESLREAVRVVRSVGIDPQKTQLGMNTAWPGNYLFPKEFLSQGLSFVTVDENKLAQAYLAADVAKNPRVRNFYDPIKIAPHIAIPERMIVNAAAESNIAVGSVDRAMLIQQADSRFTDRAMMSDIRKLPGQDEVGGIDLNPALLDLQIKRDDKGVPLPLPQQPIRNMKIEGFLPVIINITPITNLPLLSGTEKPQEKVPELSSL